MKNFDMDVRRLALIQRVVERLVQQRKDVGKTKVQKISYFLQEAVGVPLKYRFRMHYFGPYSDDLDNALSLSRALGYVKIAPDPNGFGYHVTPGEVTEDRWFQGYDMAEDAGVDVKKVEQVIDILGDLKVHELELYASIHFIGKSKSGGSKERTLATVGKVKPGFKAGQIEQAYQKLQEANLIHLS